MKNISIYYKVEFEFVCSMTPGLSKDIWSHVLPYSIFVIHQIQYQTTSKMNSQLGVCIWPLQSSFGIDVKSLIAVWSQAFR